MVYRSYGRSISSAQVGTYQGDPMARKPQDEEAQTDTKAQASTPQIDRLESLANTAATAAQARQWRARQYGLREQEEASEVRSLKHDAEARAQAEAAMKRMMANPKGKRR
ncbi:hypothetical protein [Microvirga arsenatis]|uniref:hypothetical protein n=1 Tax=Microvirga arsenatis TaxID=2692265 RepID=UPI00191C6064|nr:hypothetical protein [Microvirga arsenatis]